MKRILVVSFALLISIIAFAVPAFATEVDEPVSLEVQGLTSDDIPANFGLLRVKSHLGDLELVIPQDVPSEAFVLDGQHLRNLTDSTVYLYCIQFPEYTFSAQRYGVLTYRVNNTGVNQKCNTLDRQQMR